MINFSSLAKPFEKTDNSYRLHETIKTTEKIPNIQLPFRVTNNNNDKASVDEVSSDRENKKVVSLTTGFSIRRNPNNTNNPYTLTVITRPFDKFYNQHRDATKFNERPVNTFSNEDFSGREISIESQEDTIINPDPSESSLRRKDASPEFVSQEDDQPIYVRPVTPKLTVKQTKPRIKLAPTTTPSTTKYYLKTVIKRPAPFGANEESKEDSTENTINTDVLIETGLQNARANGHTNFKVNDTVLSDFPKWDQYGTSDKLFQKPTVSPYRALDNLRSVYDNKEVLKDYTTSTTSTTLYTTPAPREFINKNVATEGRIPKSYYSYSVVDEEIPDHTTEVLSGTVKNIIKAFLNTIASPAPRPRPVLSFTSTTPSISTTQQPEEKVVNIGFQKRTQMYVDEKPLRNNVKRLQIITEPTPIRFVSPSIDTLRFSERDNDNGQDFSSTTSTTRTTTNIPFVYNSPLTTSFNKQSSIESGFHNTPAKLPQQSKFNVFVLNKPEPTEDSYKSSENSRKFQNLLTDKPSTVQSLYDSVPYSNDDNEVTRPTKPNPEISIIPTEIEWNRPINKIPEIATTTSTTKSTTIKVPLTSTAKSLSFPTRASRVNPAIKLAATNPGGGRRSYQSSSKCSSDNSLQANPKCNEIKYQRYYTPASSLSSLTVLILTYGRWRLRLLKSLLSASPSN